MLYSKWWMEVILWLMPQNSRVMTETWGCCRDILCEDFKVRFTQTMALCLL